MKYNWPKFKLCRREGVNLYWTPKYDPRKRKKTPGQHWGSMPRLSEYWKLLRNKQVLKRMYLLTEKQFKRTIIDEAWKYSKNKWISHDVAALQFLERRLDSVLLRAGVANTIMQARQMIGHWHFLLNWNKHNSSSYFAKIWDKLTLKPKLVSSPLYSNLPLNSWNYKLPSWINVKKDSMEVELLDFPRSEELELPADILKVIEFYARA